MKNTLLILLLFFTIKLGAQTVRVDFVPGCPEEFDVFFKKGFESLGYDVYINYHSRSEIRLYDQLVNYEWKDNLLRVSLFDKSGIVLVSGEKKFPYLDGIENLVYLFLSDLMDSRVNVKEYRGKVKGLHGNEMVKLDSATYLIETHDSDSTHAIKNFLRIAEELTGEFIAYYDFSFYQDMFMSGLVIMPFNASKVFGVAIGKPKDGTSSKILTEPPDVFNSYLEDILKNNPLPSCSPVKDTECRLYLMRSTGFVGSFVPVSVFVDNRFECYLKNEEYMVLSLKPGQHYFAVQNNDKEVKDWTSTFETTINPGQNAFIKLIAHYDKRIIYQVEKEYSSRIIIQNLVKSNCVID